MECKVPKIHDRYYIAPRPGLLSDSRVFLWVMANTLHHDTSGKRWQWQHVGWKRETSGPRQGQLGFILRDPMSGSKVFAGINPFTSTVVMMGYSSEVRPAYVPPKSPKKRPGLFVRWL